MILVSLPNLVVAYIAFGFGLSTSKFKTIDLVTAGDQIGGRTIGCHAPSPRVLALAPDEDVRIADRGNSEVAKSSTWV